MLIPALPWHAAQAAATDLPAAAFPAFTATTGRALPVIGSTGGLGKSAKLILGECGLWQLVQGSVPP
jgi:hypothetical protein